ncbi:DUF2946 family protein [Azospirillum sp. B4]|uniref:DUF2946 family protein n=1 Tax=Azospirillum sp. B4 TaxID=95605 RepID=UPI0011DCEF0D|nr:DUF2946 family protein [Azospirillum sp. B4]
MQRRRRHRAWRVPPQGRPFLRWAWVLMAVLALRGLIPVGYMPNPAAGSPGASAIILCDSVHDALSNLMDPMAHHHHHGDGDGHAGHTGHGMDAPCVFAAVAALAAVLLVVALVLSPRRDSVSWAPAAATPWPRTRPPGTRLARGPPVLPS